MILITRSNDIYFSPRIEKYINYFIENKIEHIVIGWDRLGKKLKKDNTIYYNKITGYELGGFKASLYRIKWMFFLFKVFLNNRRQLTVIHACDLDTAFPATIFKMFFNKKTIIIFDVCDWFSDTLYNQNKIIRFVFRIMEEFTIKYCDEVIICEPERIEQIPYKLKHNELILPNIPAFKDTSFLCYDNSYQFDDDKIVISYVGKFGDGRMLNELLTIARKGLINLLIAGYGSKYFEDKCSKLTALTNVKYFEKVEYKVGLNIMFNSEIIYAAYSKTNPNNLFAAPNKYYEAMLLGKPIISTKGINLTSKILNNGIGYVIDETESDLIALVQNLDRANMSKKGKLALKLWNEKYKTYTSNFLNNEYNKLVKNIKIYSNSEVCV